MEQRPGEARNRLSDPTKQSDSSICQHVRKVQRPLSRTRTNAYEITFPRLAWRVGV